ncbi:Protein fmp32, mitochondrial [Oleoguttula sp. CCFEE 5521]
MPALVRSPTSRNAKTLQRNGEMARLAPLRTVARSVRLQAVSPHTRGTLLARHSLTNLPCNRKVSRSITSAAFKCSAWPTRQDGKAVDAIRRHISRPFTTTARNSRDHHFDTLKFIQRLQMEGFSEEQSVAMMKVLSDVIEESIQNLTRTMVLREDQEKATYTQKVDFAKLRSELLSADSTESALTRGSHERLTNELAKLNSRLRDEVQRTQASVRLDLNLEKGRIREEANSQDLKIKETETRIEQETAALRERLEAVKFTTLQWLMGVCTGTAAIILGVWRLLM